MKKITLSETREFSEKSFSRFLLHDSPFFRVLNFNLRAGQVFPVHSHPAEGQLTIHVIEGEGSFLADNDTSMPALCGDILVSEISEPHGVQALTDMRIVVTIAPPF